MKIFAFGSSLLYSSAAYEAAGKLTKPAWCVILGLGVALTFIPIGGLLLTLVSTIAAFVYLADVRPGPRRSHPPALRYRSSATRASSGLEAGGARSSTRSITLCSGRGARSLPAKYSSVVTGVTSAAERPDSSKTARRRPRTTSGRRRC